MITSHDTLHHFTSLICHDILTGRHNVMAWRQVLTTQRKVMYHYQIMIRLCDVFIPYWYYEPSWPHDVMSWCHNVMSWRQCRMWLIIRVRDIMMSWRHVTSYFDVMTSFFHVTTLKHDVKWCACFQLIMWVCDIMTSWHDVMTLYCDITTYFTSWCESII